MNVDNKGNVDAGVDTKQRVPVTKGIRVALVAGLALLSSGTILPVRAQRVELNGPFRQVAKISAPTELNPTGITYKLVETPIYDEKERPQLYGPFRRLLGKDASGNAVYEIITEPLYNDDGSNVFGE